MFVKILLSLKAVSSDRHAVVRSVKNIGILQFTHGVKFLQNSPDLNINIFAAGKLAAKFISNCFFISVRPDSTDTYFVADSHVGIIKRMSREVVWWKSRLF